VKGWKKIFQVNNNQKSWSGQLIADNIYFWSKIVTREKQGHYTSMRWSIHQEDKSYNHLHTKRQSPQIYAANISRTKGERQFYNM